MSSPTPFLSEYILDNGIMREKDHRWHGILCIALLRDHCRSPRIAPTVHSRLERRERSDQEAERLLSGDTQLPEPPPGAAAQPQTVLRAASPHSDCRSFSGGDESSRMGFCDVTLGDCAEACCWRRNPSWSECWSSADWSCTRRRRWHSGVPQTWRQSSARGSRS